MREAALTFGDARTNFIDPYVNECILKKNRRTLYFAVTTCVTAISFVWQVQSCLRVKNAHWLNPALSVGASCIALIINLVVYILHKQYSDRYISFGTQLSTQFGQKFQNHPLDDSLLLHFCNFLRHSDFKIRYLSAMDFKQLDVARVFLGDEEFRALLPRLNGNRNRAVNEHRILERIILSTPQEISDVHLPQLASRSDEPNFRNFVYSLHTKLIVAEKYRAIQDVFLHAFPFITPIELKHPHGLGYSDCPLGFIHAFRNGAIEAQEGIRILINPAALLPNEMGSTLEGILRLFMNIQVGQLTEEHKLEWWQAALKFAVTYMNGEMVTLVEKSAERLSLTYSLTNVNKLIAGYEQARHSSPMLEALYAQRASMTAA